MVGLIWVMQIVHYPLFAEVGETTYRGFQADHMTRISKLLAVPWAAEVLSAIALVFLAPTSRLRTAAIIGLGLVGLVAAITAFGAAPVHGGLLDGFDGDAHRRLLTINWTRTLVWTARGILAAALVWWTVRV